MTECRAASPKSIAAGWTDGQLMIAAAGESPSSGWGVSIEMSVIDVWPPEFLIVECLRSDINQPVVTPYSETRVFALATHPGSTITIQTAAGPQTIPVESPSDASTGGDVVSVSVIGSDLSAALSAAVRRVRRDENPNVPITAIVDEIRFTEGGIMPPVLELHIRRG